MRYLLAAAVCLLPATAMAQRGHGHSGGSHSKASGSEVHHREYVTKKGTYVAPHTQTAPNDTRSDNWSTKGNANPYTGKEGTKPLNP